jgi:membrane protease subunit HflK
MGFNGKYKEPDAQDLLSELDNFFNRIMRFISGGGSGNEGTFIFKIILVFLVLWGGLSSFYTVQPDEEAVVLRFGRYKSSNGPGLHFKLPFGFDEIIKLQTKQILQEEFGFRTMHVREGGGTQYRKRGLSVEGLMLTGDLNIADVEWVVQYQIADPYKFVFSTSNPQKNIRDVSEAIIRRVVGDRLVNAVFERTGMATEAKILIQEVLDKYNMGVRVVAIEFQDVLPPEIVRPSFNEVNAARQELEQLINQAEARYNKVIPEARGKAEQTIAEAEGRSLAIINTAKGDAEKFTSILTEYTHAPRVTKERLYLETMEKIHSRIEQMTIVDPEIKGLLPIFSKEGK